MIFGVFLHCRLGLKGLAGKSYPPFLSIKAADNGIICGKMSKFACLND